MFFVFLLLYSFSIFAFPSEKTTLKAMTVDGNYPYNFVKDARLQGIVLNIANELASRLDLDLQVEVVPWTRALLVAKNEPSIMAFSVARIPERERNYYWIGPVASNEEWLFKLKSRSDITIKSLDDVSHYLVGDVAGSASIPTLEKLRIKVDTAPSMQSNCKPGQFWMCVNKLTEKSNMVPLCRILSYPRLTCLSSFQLWRRQY